MPRIGWLGVLLATLAGCGSAGGSGEAGAIVAQVTVQPDGNVVAEGGGEVKVTAPAGAVTEDTQVTVQIFTASAALTELGVTLDLDPTAVAFRFTTDHEVLLPLTFRVHTEQDTLATGIDFALYVPVVVTADGAAAVAGSPVTEADDATGEVDLQFLIDPTKIAFGDEQGGFYFIVQSSLSVMVETTVPGQGVPPEVAVGDVVETRIVFACADGGSLVPSGGAAVALDAPGWQAQSGAPGGDVQFGSMLQQEDPPCDPDWLYEFGDKNLKRVSGTEVTWSVTIPPETTWNTKGGTPVQKVDDHHVFVSSEILEKKIDATGVGPLIKADQIAFSTATLFNFARANETMLYVGCAPDLALLSADDGTIEGTVVSSIGPEPTMGGFPMTTRPNWFSRASLAATEPVVDAMVFYGNTGFGIRHWVPEIDGFGATEVDPSAGSVSDGDTYEEDKSRAVVVYSSRNQVRFVEFVTDPFPPFNARFTQRDVFAKGIRSTQFPGATGFAVSAARRTDTSPVYFVTVGATPNDPGKLWRLDNPTDTFSQATLVGSVENVPRRIRFLKSIGIVSNSFSDSLTILVRDASDNVTIKGTVSVGDGPIGIGLIELPNGNIGVASAGFLDNTYTITILEPDGDVVSNVTNPVPNGGDKPACAVFANPEGTKVAVACSGSDEVILIPIG